MSYAPNCHEHSCAAAQSSDRLLKVIHPCSCYLNFYSALTMYLPVGQVLYGRWELSERTRLRSILFPFLASAQIDK